MPKQSRGPRGTNWSLRVDRQGNVQALSPLESDIMRKLWKNPHSKAEDLVDAGTKAATVRVVLQKLKKRGMVDVSGKAEPTERGRKALLYQPSIDREEFGQFVSNILSSARDKAVTEYGLTNDQLTQFKSRISKSAKPL